MPSLNTISRLTIGTALCAALILTFTLRSASGDLPGTQKERSFQNLAYTLDGVFGHYFQANPDTGEFSLNIDRDQNNSGSHWRIQLDHRHRDYGRAYSIQQRGNGVYNSWYLSIDKDSGELKLVPHRENWETRWRIRYAGKHHGYDAFVIQNLAETGRHDMKFLTLDPITKKPRLDRTLDDAGYWFMDVVDDLPTDY